MLVSQGREYTSILTYMIKFQDDSSGCQVRASAGASEGQAIRISAIPGQIVESPGQSIPDVVDLSRVDKFWRMVSRAQEYRIGVVVMVVGAYAERVWFDSVRIVRLEVS